MTDTDDNGSNYDSSGQYFLLKLNSREMKWREALFGGEAAVLRLERND